MKNPIVVVGGGQAAITCISRLRMLGFEGGVKLITNESVLPYQRPPLSKQFLLGKMTFEQLIFQPQSWFDESEVEVMLDSTVEQIDRENHQVILSNGDAVSYHKLVLTPGATPIHLPENVSAGLGNVFVIRDLPHVQSIQQVLNENSKVLIVGGGYIGLEAAAVARTVGASVTLVEAQQRILQRVACSETSAYFRDLHRANGVDVRENAMLSSLSGVDGLVTRGELDNGDQIDADVVLVGIGVRPNIAMAKQAGLEIDNGIMVNDYCQSSDADIYAAGDCASFIRNGERIRLESVQNANGQGDTIAHHLSEQAKPYDATPWFWSDQYDTKLQIAGLNMGYTETVVRPSAKPNGLSVWYFRDDQLIAVDAMNEPGAFSVTKRALDLGKSPSKQEVADPEIDLKSIMKSLANR